MLFHNGKRGRSPLSWVLVETVRVRVIPTIKYLGFTLDVQWGFSKHFASLALGVGKMADALARLIPNLDGPGDSVRKMYADAVMFYIMYGAAGG